ncbi:MAG TPA: carbohydrate porin [Chthoniobacterales bacterium]
MHEDGGGKVISLGFDAAPWKHAGRMKIRTLVFVMFAGMSGSLRAYDFGNGFSLSVSYIGEIMADVSGGTSTGVIAEGSLEVLANIDMDKAFGWRGTTLHASLMYPHGTSLTTAHTGDFSVVSSIDAYDSVRLYEAWADQTFLDSGLSLRAGFLAADVDFAVMGMAAPLVNSTFGAPFVLTGNFAMSTYPYSALGLRLGVEPVPGWNMKLGVYDGNVAPGVFHDPTPGASPSNEFNKHGIHFALRRHEGAMLFGEIEWEKPGLHDVAVKFGAVYHTDRFGAIYNATSATLKSRQLPRDAPGFGGNYAFYIIVERELWHERDTEHDGFGIFARVVVAPEDRNFFPWSAEIGLAYRGLFQSSAADNLAVGIAGIGISSKARDAYYDADLRAPKDEFIVEATYQYALNTWCTLQPDVQWVIHPGGTAGGAVVIGFRTTVVF